MYNCILTKMTLSLKTVNFAKYLKMENMYVSFEFYLYKFCFSLKHQIAF